MLKLKICGLRDPENIKQVALLNPNMVGFVFYEGSSRNITEDVLPIEIPSSIEKVGVFVNSEISYIDSMVKKFHLNSVQLYHEDLKPFRKLRIKVKLIKALSIEKENDIYKTRSYAQDCDLFLFDTKGKNSGGNGIKFDWQILRTYEGRTPFLLSGGITPGDAELINLLKHENMIGIDINSKFETAPGIKNIEVIKQFRKELYENFEYHK